ncbi:MAG: hypothetical protein AAGC46_18665 [Solirubrobacteraceae bacterium]
MSGRSGMRAPRSRLAGGLAAGVAAAGIALALTTGAGASTPEGFTPPTATTTSTTPDAPVATFTIPGSIAVLPTISADGDTVAWSIPEGGEWTLHAAVDGKAIDHVFDRQRWPIDVSVGHATGEDPVVLFSRCARSKAKTRLRAQGCDLYRLSSVADRGTPVLLTSVADRGKVANLRGASTNVGSETVPSLAGHWLLFARTDPSRQHGSLVARDTRNGAEHLLPHGDLGRCSGSCAKNGFAAGTPKATSIAGSRFGVLWESTGGADALGISGNDEVLRGSVTSSRLGSSAGRSFVSGTDSSVQYSSVQQLGTTTQDVRHAYDGDGPTPAPGSQDVVQRVTSGGKVSEYADPQGRRIVAAAAAGDRLWLIRDAQAIPAGTRVDLQPELCSADVGGCTIESIPYPAFKAVSRRP